MTDIIEVIEKGPQGTPGTNGTGTNDIALLESVVVQTVLTHNELEATEKTLLVDDFSSSDLSIVNGEITLLKEFKFTSMFLYLSVQKSGGSTAELTTWVEYSTDSGSSWLIVPLSLKSDNVGTDSLGNLLLEFTIGVLPIGTVFRFKMTNTGGANLSLEPHAPITTSRGVVAGRSVKITLAYGVVDA